MASRLDGGSGLRSAPEAHLGDDSTKYCTVCQSAQESADVQRALRAATPSSFPFLVPGRRTPPPHSISSSAELSPHLDPDRRSITHIIAASAALTPTTSVWPSTSWSRSATPH